MRTEQALWGLIGLWLLAATYAWLQTHAGGFPLPHGTGKLPGGGFRTGLAVWFVLGTLGLAAVGRALQDHLAAVRRLLGAGEDHHWMAGLGLLAVGLGFSVHLWVYLGLPITQDEDVYRFGAEILATGHLYADSPPDRLFYANNLIVNDGKWYPQYFIGWPALLAPFMAIGLPGLANPIYFGATVPAVFLAVRGVVGSTAARAGAALFATAPLAVFAAGSSLSHTTTLGLLCWVAVVSIAARGQRAVPFSVLLAVLFCGAFFIRPTTALGVGGPFLVLWLIDRLQARDLRSLAAFALPATGFALCFLWVNQIQNGSPTTVAYQRYVAHAREMGLRFSSVRREAVVANFRFDAWRVLTLPFEGLFRLNYASLGWPFAVFFVLPALRLRGAWIYLGSLISMLLMHCLLDVTGMDLFGPVHVMEALFPLVVLVTLGLTVLWRANHAWPVATALAAALFAPITYAPTRIQNIHGIASAHRRIRALADDLPPAVVFVQEGRFTRKCLSKRLRIRHNFRPVNPLALDGPVLWLNALNPQRDRAFLAGNHPDRAGYYLKWNRRCQPRLEPIQ